MIKKCTKCKKLKNVSCFSKDKGAKDGLVSNCKQCQRDYYKIYYNKNSEKVNEKTRLYRKTHEKWRKKMDIKYSKTEKGKARRLKAHRLWKKKNPLKYRAHMRIAKAVMRGKLKKGNCVFPDGKCEGRIEAHHWDYSKPLDVVWFCKKHHMLVDKIYHLIQLKCH